VPHVSNRIPLVLFALAFPKLFFHISIIVIISGMLQNVER